MLEVVQLGCERGDILLFTRLSFQLDFGEVLQIEGSNGVGKTTLLRVIAGLSFSYIGQIFWNQQPLSKVYTAFRFDSFFLGHKPGLKLDLTPLENLVWRARLSNTIINQGHLIHALERVGLFGYEHIPCGHLSAGQLRRVTFALLLSSRARLWILDEPFTSIDSEGVLWLEAFLKEHTRQGGMILVTSHQPLQDCQLNLCRLNLEDFVEQ